MASDDWPALHVALAAAPAAERERLFRTAIFRDPVLAQWRYHALLLARARALLAADGARPRREFPRVGGRCRPRARPVGARRMSRGAARAAVLG